MSLRRLPLFWQFFAAVLPIGLLAAGAAMLLLAPSMQAAGSSRQVIPALLLVAGIALAAAAISWAASRSLARDCRALAAACETAAAGDYGQAVAVSGADELSRLAASFNQMNRRLAAEFTRLAEDRQQLRMILGGMVEGVVALDDQQRILFANQRAGELLDLQVDSSLGLRFWEVVRKRSLQDLVGRAMTESEPYREEVVWTGPATKSLTVHVARLPGAAPRGAVMVLHDTSELRRLERLRSDFVANVSHELKTPLAIIKACVETLVDGAAEDPRHRAAFLEKISDQSNRLQSLILDLLSLARIESGAETFEFETLPLARIVPSAVLRHAARAEANELTLVAETPPDQESQQAECWADEEAVNQILDNLIDNALKYTPRGGKVAVRWRLQADQVLLEVQDNGIGIPEADLPRIFERFYRVDKARARELGGTGLGLSIVKHLAQAMRGGVTATSRLGGGTTFCVRLARRPAPRSSL